jgi:hypothetical protein
MKRQSLFMDVEISAEARLQAQQGPIVGDVLSLSVNGRGQLRLPDGISPREEDTFSTIFSSA